MKRILVLLLLLAVASLASADDALVLPKGVMRIYITGAYGFVDSAFDPDGEKVEGWWFERKEVNGELFYIYDEPRCGNALKHPAHFYEELQRFEVNGALFWIPNHIESWLIMMYSSDWHRPQKNRKYNNQR